MSKTGPSTRLKHNLSAKEQRAVVKAYKKTGSQKKAAKSVGVAKWRVNLYLKAKGIGKQVVQPFWKDVKAHMKLTGSTHKESTEAMKFSPKWKAAYKKRTGKARLHWKDKDEIRHKLRAAYEELDEEQKMQGIEYEGETYYETPK